MRTGESNGSSDYKYYPIPYPNKVLSTHLTFNMRQDDGAIWILPTDRTKYLCGFRNDWETGIPVPDMFAIISIGF